MWSFEYNGFWLMSEYRCVLENNFNILFKIRDWMM